MRRVLRGLLLPLMPLLAACAPGATTPAAPEIRYGEDICAECKMLISDARFAAGYAYEVAPGRYESKAFDDIGGMLLHAQKNPEDAVEAWYVHDHESEEWLDATEAFYVVNPDTPTPMGYGILAFGDEATAQSVAAEPGGTIMTWDELRDAEIGHGHQS